MMEPILPAKTDDNSDPIIPGEASFYIAAGLLLLGTIEIYWRTLRFPYIQDDWLVINAIASAGPMTVIKNALFSIDALIYRPIGTLYMVLVYLFSGTDATGFHLIALFIHALNSLLVAMVVSALTKRSVVAWTTAFLYMASASLHSDPLLWMSGISDLGGVFFFLLTVYLYLEGETRFSLGTFLLALFTNDLTIVTPFVLLLLSLPIDEKQRFRLRTFVGSWPHFLAAIGYVALRREGFQPVADGLSRSFASASGVFRLVAQGVTAIDWCVNALVPTADVAVIGFLLFLMIAVLAVIYFRRTGMRLRQLSILLGWFFLAIIPPLLLPGLSYRSYLLYALPAFLAISVYALYGACVICRIPEKLIPASAIVVVALVGYFSATMMSAQEEKGMSAERIAGTNDLMYKGACVLRVKEFLEQTYPSPSQRTTFIFAGIPAEAIGGSAGPRTWYHDSTIVVREAGRGVSGFTPGDPMPVNDEFVGPVRLDVGTTYVISSDRGTFSSYRLIENYASTPLPTGTVHQ